MAVHPLQIGVREFQEDLGRYLDSPVPLAITRHGQTVGYFIPTRRRPDREAIQEFERAVADLQALLAKRGIDVDAVVEEFDARRRAERRAPSRR